MNLKLRQQGSNSGKSTFVSAVNTERLLFKTSSKVFLFQSLKENGAIPEAGFIVLILLLVVYGSAAGPPMISPTGKKISLDLSKRN